MSHFLSIDDLAHPSLTDLQQAAIEYTSSNPVRFDRDTMMSTAIQKTGLDHWGSLDFIQRLDLQIAAVEQDTGLNPLGRLSIYNDMVRYLANRLQFEAYRLKHPEYDQIALEDPLVVVGLPRSGTTHLLNMMAADPRLQSIPYWESRQPFVIATEQASWDDQDPRYQRCAQEWAMSEQLLPLLKAMHEMSPDHVHEELELENLDFSSYNLDWMARVPAWRDFYLSQNQAPHYLYMKQVLKAVVKLNQLKQQLKLQRQVLQVRRVNFKEA